MAPRVDGLENHVVPERVMGRILPTGAGADTIATVIAKCPSGAARSGAAAQREVQPADGDRYPGRDAFSRFEALVPFQLFSPRML